MAINLSDLTTPTTQAQAQAALLAQLAGGIYGFPTTSWQPGSLPAAIIGAEAFLHADATTLISKIANGGFLDYAALAGDDWLTLLAAQLYQTTRNPPVIATGTMILKDGGGGPSTITAGQLLVSTTGPVGTLLRYRNIDDGTYPKTLLLNSVLPVLFAAESPGAKYNVSTNTPMTLVTSLAGVTVTNPGTSGAWLTVTGTDLESNASLISRCKARWPDLGSSATAAVYQRWATTASPEVVKVRVFENAAGNGNVGVYIAGAAGPASATAVGLVATYISIRRPLCVTVSVFPTTVASVSVTGTAYVQAAYANAFPAALLAVITSFQNSLGIGATVYTAKLIQLIEEIQGVVNFAMTSPLVDFVPANTASITLTTNIVVVAQ